MREGGVSEVGEGVERFAPGDRVGLVAENRVELKTMHKSITPDPADYRRAVSHLQAYVREHRSLHDHR